MSDNWTHYFSITDGPTVSVFFDDGIAEIVDQLPQNHSLKIRVLLRDPDENGLSNNEEAEILNGLEDRIEALIQEVGGVYLGRVTYDGKRIFSTLVGDDTQQLQEQIKSAGQASGYDARFSHQPDPGKDAYWQGLYPSSDERRVLNDMTVISNLIEHGDTLSASRRVDHWVFFSDFDHAKGFTDWAMSEGCNRENLTTDNEAPDKARKWQLQLSHECTMELPDITGHTRILSNKAAEFSGEYDGWETLIVQGEA
ncbi:MAG: DUF695 domain-containing protein [Pseudomonadota bacterium]